MVYNVTVERDYGPGKLQQAYTRTRNGHLLVTFAIVEQARVDQLFRTGDTVTDLLDFRVERQTEPVDWGE